MIVITKEYRCDKCMCECLHKPFFKICIDKIPTLPQATERAENPREAFHIFHHDGIQMPDKTSVAYHLCQECLNKITEEFK